MSGPMRKATGILACGFPLPAPEPVPGGEDRARFAGLIASIGRRGDLSAADLRVLTARHRKGAH